MPWQLYHKSRSRSSSSRTHRTDSDEDIDPLHEAAELALSELRSFELFYLFLSILVPFLGAHLISHIFYAMGVDSLSWFSTTLFVLATGVRPWSHLVKRLHQRMDDLQEAVHKPYNEEHNRVVDEQLSSIMTRLDALETVLEKVSMAAAQVEPLQAACDDLTEAFGDIERVVYRHERKMELARVSHNNRLAVLETGLVRLEERNKHELISAARGSRLKDVHHHNAVVQSFLNCFDRLHRNVQRLFDFVLSALPSYMMSRRPTPLSRQPSSSSSPPLSPSALHPSALNTNATYSFNGTPLETIPEAADSDSDGTYVSDKDISATTKQGSRNRSRSRSHSGPRKYQPATVSRSYSARAVDFAAAVAGWPYRVVVTVFTIIIPDPIQKVFV